MLNVKELTGHFDFHRWNMISQSWWSLVLKVAIQGRKNWKLENILLQRICHYCTEQQLYSCSCLYRAVIEPFRPLIMGTAPALEFAIGKYPHLKKSSIVSLVWLKTRFPKHLRDIDIWDLVLRLCTFSNAPLQEFKMDSTPQELQFIYCLPL